MQSKQRSYKEIMDDVQKANYGKEMRALHKELKQHEDHYGGLPMFMRYPNLPDIAMMTSGVISAILFIVAFIRILIKAYS